MCTLQTKLETLLHATVSPRSCQCIYQHLVLMNPAEFVTAGATTYAAVHPRYTVQPSTPNPNATQFRGCRCRRYSPSTSRDR